MAREAFTIKVVRQGPVTHYHLFLLLPDREGSKQAKREKRKRM